MAHAQAGFIERWSGKLLRWLMAYLFVLGAAVTVLIIVNLAASIPGIISGSITGPVTVDIIFGPALMVPYLVIRYRDPESTTIPFANRFHQG